MAMSNNRLRDYAGRSFPMMGTVLSLPNVNLWIWVGYDTQPSNTYHFRTNVTHITEVSASQVLGFPAKEAFDG